MSNINGDWFHSRISSNLGELLVVRKLVTESQKTDYAGLKWSSGRHDNPQLYQFASSVDIEPSTMQTKIRAMIRYGFIRDGNICPLNWTRLGNLWNDLYSIGNYRATKSIYEITLTISLAFYAFNDSKRGYSVNPSKGDLPLKKLFNLLSSDNNSISLKEFEFLVDGNTSRRGKNFSYWKTDLLNSGLFTESDEYLIYTGKYPELVEEIKKFEPVPLNDEDWIQIRDNPLIEKSPFNKTLKEIFIKITEQKSNNDVAEYEKATTEPLIEIVSEEEERIIPDIDILSQGTKFTRINQRVRNFTWALRIKEKYAFKCVVPNCDVNGKIFVEAAHIKPDSVEESEIPHRSHILNGLCLCANCHKSFDKGLFSLTDDYKIIVSKKFDKIPDQHLKKIILSSQEQVIKPRTDSKKPMIEFIQYHRNFIFNF